jgi:hypothetical protein
MQQDLDAHLVQYNTKRPHQGRNMKGQTPYAVFTASVPKPRRDTRKEAKQGA